MNILKGVFDTLQDFLFERRQNWYQKLTLRTQNGQFLASLNQVVIQDMKNSFKKAHLDAKIY